MIQSGKIVQTMFLLTTIATYYYLSWLNKEKGFVPKIRKIAALDAMEEAVGRAAEMGRPVHVSPGTPGAAESIEAQTIAGLAVTSHVSRLCARNGVPVIATASRPELLPVLQEIVKEAYKAEGVGEAYNDENVRFLSDNSNAYAGGVQGIVEREECAANIIVGKLYGTANVLFGRATVAGKTIQIGGTAYYLVVPHLVVTCDYVLMGEEVFVAEAYLNQDPKQLITVFAQDIFKIISLGLLIIGLLTYSMGSNLVIDFLNT